MELWAVLLMAFGIPIGMLLVVTLLIYFFGTDPFTKDRWYRTGR